MRAVMAFFVGFACIVGCASDENENEVEPNKDDFREGKMDGIDLCPAFGFEPGCDFCLEFGWYEDNVCDDFCDEPDPYCTTFECMGVISLNFFDLAVVDIGDEEGMVYINDGGAPLTYDAEYDDLSSEHGNEQHSFVFGFDDYNAGLIDDLHSIEITSVSYAFLRGTVEYYGEPEELVCYKMEAAQPSDIAPDFECLGLEGDTLFDLDIVDVGDEEGEVTVNDGGAPSSYDAEYHEFGNSSHDFLFGFDEYNAGDIEELYSITLEEKGISFANGHVEYEENSNIICHINN